MSFNYASKFFLYVVMAVVGGFIAAISDGHLSTVETWNLIVALLGSAAVFFKANTPTALAAKAVVAVFAAGVDVLVASWGDYHISSDELTQIVLALLGAVAVYLGQNTPSPVAAAHTRFVGQD